MAEATQRVQFEGSAEAKQIVVQCPGCQTKFLVASPSLKGIDFPRFHCSRCDNLFSLDSSALGLTSTSQPLLSSKPPSQSELFPEAEETVETANPATHARVDVLSPPAPTIDHLMIDDFTPIAESAVAGLRFDPTEGAPATPRVGSTKGIELPKGPGRGPLVEAPYEGQPETPPRSQMAFDFIASSIPSDRLFEDTPKLAPRVPPLAPPVRRTSGWRGVGTLALPMLGCLALLGLGGFAIGSNNIIDPPKLRSLFPTAPQVASPDIRVVDTSFEQIPLSNGETIHLITGTVVNDSPRDVSNVVLEGLTFDAAGRVVSSARVTSGATLAHSRLQSLTPDIIVKLQSGENSRPLKLRAGESERVSLAFTDSAVREARFFSARVYSAREMN